MLPGAWRASSYSYANGNCLEASSGWRKSSYSNVNGNCAEVDGWRTSLTCDAGSCVEAGKCGCGIAIRDSMDRDGPVLIFSASAWAGFIREVRQGA